MDNRAENVDFFFDRLREEPAMSVAELEGIVAGRKESEGRRVFVVWGAVVGMVLLVAVGGLLYDADEQPAGNRVVGTAPSVDSLYLSDNARSQTPGKLTDAGPGNPSAGPIGVAPGNSSALPHSTSGTNSAFRLRLTPVVNEGRADNIADSSRTSPTSTDDAKRSVLTGSNLIELTNEELAVMGVRVSRTGQVELYRKVRWGKKESERIYDMMGDGAGTEGVDWIWSTDNTVRESAHHWVTDSTVDIQLRSPIDESLRINYPSFSPHHVTDLNGKRFREQIRFDLVPDKPLSRQNMDEINRQRDGFESRSFGDPDFMARMIPIRVRTGNDARDVILWYYPQTEVLAALPHRVQVQLRDEVRALHLGILASDTAMAAYRAWISYTHYQIDSILAARQPALSPDNSEEDPAVTGSCYLSFCTITSGGINGAPIFPNPARDIITVGYRLMGRRVVTITLHDINGSQVRQLVAPHLKEAGRWEMQGSLAGVTPGIYLVVVSTEKQEQVVQRVIVE